MSITVLKPGMLSSFQDEGRAGFRAPGHPRGRRHGRARPSPGQPARGQRARSRHAGDHAGRAGAALRRARLFRAGRRRPGQGACSTAAPCRRCTRCWRAPATCWPSPPGPAQGRGIRAYLAVHGGFDIEPVMGSESTYLRGGFGGLRGRALAKGDTVGLRRPLRRRPRAGGAGRGPGRTSPVPARRAGARAARSPARAARLHWDSFDAESQQPSPRPQFRISPESDRMGYRLSGPGLSQRRRARCSRRQWLRHRAGALQRRSPSC